MKRTIPTWVLLVALTTTWAVAQEPPAQLPATSGNQARDKTPPQADAPPVPEQELNFDVSEETSRVTIEAKALVSNTKLQQLRYVARVDVFVVYSRKGGGQADLTLINTFRQMFGNVPAALDQLVARLPEQHPLPKELLSELLSHGRLFNLKTGSPPPNMREGIQGVQASFEILAPSPQRAKESARGLLILLDYGFYRPVHQGQLDNVELRKRELAEIRDKYEAVTAEVAKLQDLLERQSEYSDIAAESLNSLITQQRMISVDLAGVTARLEACTVLLTKTHKLPSRDRLEELKVTAEIELVGLSAKKAAIDAIVKGAKARKETLGALMKAQSLRSRVNGNLRQGDSRLADAEEIVEENTPLEVMGDVAIRRIEWVPVEEGRGQRGGSSSPWWQN